MRQYLDAKQQYRDAILFFRMGDFYEMFYEDALVAARALDLTLTSRSKDGQGTSIPMCGVPHHALDTYLVAAGQERVPRRHLRSGRRPEESQGHRQARDRPRRVAGNADRLAASRRARRPRFCCADLSEITNKHWGLTRIVGRRAARSDDGRIFLRGIRRGRRACRRWRTK